MIGASEAIGFENTSGKRSALVVKRVSSRGSKLVALLGKRRK